MRWAVDATDGAQSYHAEVTALDYGTEIAAARFTFESPPGAREADAQPAESCSGSSGPVGGASFPAEPGFLAPAHTPPGYRTAGTGSESDAYGCDPVAVWVLLEAADGTQILLRQRFRPGGMPPLDRSWQSVASGLDDAYSRRSGDGILSLLWRAGDIVALLKADGALRRQPAGCGSRAAVATDTLGLRRVRARPRRGVGGDAGVSARVARDDAREGAQTLDAEALLLVARCSLRLHVRPSPGGGRARAVRRLAVAARVSSRTPASVTDDGRTIPCIGDMYRPSRTARTTSSGSPRREGRGWTWRRAVERNGTTPGGSGSYRSPRNRAPALHALRSA